MDDPIQFTPLIQTRIMYKSFARLLGNVLAIAMGSLYFGYTLAYISVIPIEQIKDEFDIPLTPSAAKGFLSGIIPVGAGIGALLSSVFNNVFSRR